MTPKIPQMVGDTYNDMLSWRWDKSRMRYTATHDDTELLVVFHKVGGAWSKTFADGTPNTNQKRRGYWTIAVDGVSPRTAEYQFMHADQAKDAAAKMYMEQRARRAKEPA